MKFLLSILIVLNSCIYFSFENTYAECVTDINGNRVCDSYMSDPSTNNLLGKSDADLRNGNITMDDIPMMIASAIEYLLALVGSICVVALIYHAVRMQIASGITGDSSGVDRAKKGMKGSILGFILAMSAWFLMTKLVALLSTLN